jgi:protein TonB
MIAATAMLMLADVTPAPAWAEPPRPIAGYIASEDYPPEALRNDLQGRVDALLTISEAGSVVSCTIKRSSGHRLLDDTTCRLVLARYRFDPARNGDGRPVEVQAVLPVIWALP